MSSALFEGGHGAAAQAAHWSVWLFIFFGAVVSSIVANTFMLKLVQKYGVSRTTPYLWLTPVILFALAVLILHDTISLRIPAGGALTMSGVALAAWLNGALRQLRERCTGDAGACPANWLA